MVENPQLSAHGRHHLCSPGEALTGRHCSHLSLTSVFSKCKTFSRVESADGLGLTD